MRKRLLLFLCVLFSVISSYSQAPGILWQKCIGGSGRDYGNQYSNSPKMASTLLRPNGNIIIAGTQQSTDGLGDDPSFGGITVGELDPGGKWLWRRRYGGYISDEFHYIMPAVDGGYIIAASTWSGTLDNTQNRGNNDIWIFQIDDTGKMLWQKTYGGSGIDQDGSLARYGDDYVFIGTTESNNYDLKPKENLYGFDVMAMRIDKKGNLKWCKKFGGNSEEMGTGVDVAEDGSIYFSAVSHSTYGEVTPKFQGTGFSDIWIGKLDGNGNLLWQKSFGGSVNDWSGGITVINNNTIRVTGNTNSTNGDIQGSHGSVEGWLLTLNAADGGIISSRVYGGNLQDAIYDTKILPDNSTLITGYSQSTNFPGVRNHGSKDLWVAMLDPQGNVVWQNQYGGSADEMGGAIDISADGSIYVLGQSASYDQDVRENASYQTYPIPDIWAVKLGRTNKISGYVYYDRNNNGNYDNGDSLMHKATIKTTNGSDTLLTRSYNGIFDFYVSPGQYTTFVTGMGPFSLVTPASGNTTFNNYYSTDTLYFGLRRIAQKKDLAVSMMSSVQPIPGKTIPYKIFYSNRGTDTIAGGKIALVRDPKFDLVQSVPAHESISNDSIYWSFGNLLPRDSGMISVSMKLKSQVQVGDTLVSQISITPTAGDVFPDNNRQILSQKVQASWLEVEMKEVHGSYISSADEYLTYTITFQNLTEYDHSSIHIIDTLSNLLDWDSFEMISASHVYTLDIFEGNRVRWEFADIDLPTQETNEAGSAGYIVFRIKPRAGLLPGQVIKNIARAYLGYYQETFSKPVFTSIRLAVLPVHFTAFSAINRGDDNLLHWKIDVTDARKFIVERSADKIRFVTIATIDAQNELEYKYADTEPFTGDNYYRIRAVEKNGLETLSQIRLVQVNSRLVLKAYPNPVKNKLTVQIDHAKAGIAKFVIRNANGISQFEKQMTLSAGRTMKTFDISQLAAGSYFFSMQTGDEEITTRILKQ